MSARLHEWDGKALAERRGPPNDVVERRRLIERSHVRGRMAGFGAELGGAHSCIPRHRRLIIPNIDGAQAICRGWQQRRECLHASKIARDDADKERDGTVLPRALGDRREILVGPAAAGRIAGIVNRGCSGCGRAFAAQR